MCGIVGYIGNKNVAPILTSGLSKLEYRGYDSAGIATFQDNEIKIYKTSGKLQNLKDLIEEKECAKSANQIGIGHIRWATHGVPSQENAHPHISCCKTVSIVHNGIIENYKELRVELEAKGYEFVSQTDTETVAHLIADMAITNKNPKDAVRAALQKVKGAYALGVIFKNNPEILIATRKNAPLIVGVGKDENFIASDVPALLDYTKNVIYLDDEQIAEIKKDSITITDLEDNVIPNKVEQLPWEPVALSKMGYKHFMLKEIHEQPDVIRQNLSEKLMGIDKPVNLKEIKLNKEDLKNLDRIQIIACGTSLHAAMVGKYLIEELTAIPVEIETSSEYIYRKNTTTAKSLVIGVSQSGETADTLTAIRQAKAKGAHALIITNRIDSTMARDADSLLPVNAGIEVSVAATKSYTAQVLAFYLLALYLSEVKECINEKDAKKFKMELQLLPQKIETILSNTENIKKCAIHYSGTRDFIYIARGINYPVALEGALKLKEISYINATGYPAGELKHGPIAMLDSTLPVLSILMPGIVYEKVLSNSEEAKARDAKLITVTSSTDEHLNDIFEYIIHIPEVDEMFSPIITNIPLQLLAYYIAEHLGKDVDQPRNLAKSVTVE